MTRSKRIIAAAALAGGMSLVPAIPAMASPVVTGGLVNVTVTNLLNTNSVALQIPINAAANICGVSVNVLSTGISTGATYTCTARSGQQTLTITQA